MSEFDKPNEMSVAVQYLTTAADIHLNGAHLCALSDHLSSGAEHELPAENRLQVSLEEMADRYVIVIDDRVLDHEWHPLRAVERAYNYIIDSALSLAQPGFLLNAGVLSVDGRRILLIGRGQAERFLIMTALFAADAAFEGCQHCFVGPDGIVPIANRIPVNDYDMNRIPDSRRLLSITPIAEEDGMEQVYMLSPRDMGVKWYVGRGGVDAVFAVESNPGGQTRLVPADTMAVVEIMLTTCISGDAPNAQALMSLTRIVEGAKSYRLYHGDPGHSAAAIRDCLSITPGRRR